MNFCKCTPKYNFQSSTSHIDLFYRTNYSAYLKELKSSLVYLPSIKVIHFYKVITNTNNYSSVHKCANNKYSEFR